LIDESARSADGSDRTDDAASHGAAQAKWISDGKHLLPDHQVLRIADLNLGHAFGWNLDYRQVVYLIGADDLCLVSFFVTGGDLDLARVFDHVEVGQDVSFAVEDESGASTLLRNGAVKEVVSHCCGGDVHHRGQRLLVDGNVLLLF